MNSSIGVISITAAVFFILGIKLLSSPKTARLGNLVASCGMLAALLATLALPSGDGKTVVPQCWTLNHTLVLAGVAIGLGLGALGAYSVKMTAMPQMVALFNGVGGGAAALVGSLEFLRRASSGEIPLFFSLTMLFATVVGSLSFTGSLVAFCKLQGYVERPRTFPGQNLVNGLVLAGILGLCVSVVGWTPASVMVFCAIFALALLFGVVMVMPIGGADMPVVISLLNSLTGLAVAADGFTVNNIPMIVAGSLVGSSGTLLTLLMCKAMNRPVSNVLFGAFGVGAGGELATACGSAGGNVKPIQADEAAMLLSYAQQVVIVPGYGMAVAQAQHQVRELSEELSERGVDVRFAIHPVAGRMPGHMNVLLAEAEVPYDQLCEMESVNLIMDRVDVCLVIGANDVVNPAARDEKSSPIYGMPIIEVDRGRTVIVLKRSMAAGFAGIENQLFYKSNTRMLFGDAKASLQALIAQLNAS